MRTMAEWLIDAAIILFIVSPIYLLGNFIWTITRPNARSKLKFLGTFFKHYRHQGFSFVKDDRYPGHLIARCPEHGISIRSKRDWQAFNG